MKLLEIISIILIHLVLVVLDSVLLIELTRIGFISVNSLPLYFGLAFVYAMAAMVQLFIINDD